MNLLNPTVDNPAVWAPPKGRGSSAAARQASRSSWITVADDEGGTMTSTATVLVETPAAATVTLVNTINTLSGLSGGEKNSLTAKLNAAAKGKDNASVCGQHAAFVNQVKALLQTGRLSPATAAMLLSADQSIRSSLGCPSELRRSGQGWRTPPRRLRQSRSPRRGFKSVRGFAIRRRL